jgi:hypothetical protein
MVRTSLVSALLLSMAGPVLAESITVSIRTFIPEQHPSLSGYMLPVPGQSGRTMLPDAPLLAECFGTDNRSFSTDANASVRFGGDIMIDTAAMTHQVREVTGRTIEYDCDSGRVVCEEVAGAGGFMITDVAVNGTDMTLSYRGGASNPCLTLAPAISFSGTVTVQTATRTVNVGGRVDVFPSFEAVLVKADGTRVHLYRVAAGLLGADHLLTNDSLRREVSWVE